MTYQLPCSKTSSKILREPVPEESYLSWQLVKSVFPLLRTPATFQTSDASPLPLTGQATALCFSHLYLHHYSPVPFKWIFLGPTLFYFRGEGQNGWVSICEYLTFNNGFSIIKREAVLPATAIYGR